MQNPKEQPVDPLIETLYRLAKTKDEQNLKTVLGDFCIGIVRNNETVIRLLAREGDEQSVNFLLTKFNGNFNEALIGAAQSANRELMHKMLGTGASLHYALYGAVLGNQVELVEQILNKGSISIDLAIMAAAKPGLEAIYNLITTRRYSAACAAENDALEGAGMYNNKILMDQLIQKRRSIAYAICGAATVGNFELVDQLLQHPNLTDDNRPHAIGMALLGAAKLGSVRCIDKYNTDPLSVDFIAMGLGITGNSILLDYYIPQIFPEDSSEKSHFLDMAIESAAAGGHLELIDKLTKLGASPSRALQGAASGGHIAIINTLSTHIDDNTNIRDNIIVNFRIKQIIKNNPEQMLRLASFINDEKLRNLFLEDTLGLDTTLKPNVKEKTLNKLIKKARVINKLMNEKNINYNQAMAWDIEGVHIWLLRLPTPPDQPLTLLDGLPKDLHDLILSYVAPLSREELADLVTKMKADHSRIRSTFHKLTLPDTKAAATNETDDDSKFKPK